MDWTKLESAISDASEESNKLNIFLYGLPGTGKTRFIGSAARLMPTLLLKAEEGALSVADTPCKVLPLIEAGKDPRVRLAHVLAYLRSPEGQRAFRCVALDTLSSYQHEIVNHIRRNRKGGALQLKDWGEVIDATTDALGELSKLPQTIIVTCHSQEIEQDEGGVLVRPALSGKKLPNGASALYDISAYTGRQKVDNEIAYVSLTSFGSEKYVVKDRTGKLDPVEPTDFAVWHRKIYGGPDA